MTYKKLKFKYVGNILLLYHIELITMPPKSSKVEKKQDQVESNNEPTELFDKNEIMTLTQEIFDTNLASFTNRNPITKEDYELLFQEVNNLFMKTTNVVRIFDAKRDEMISVIVNIQNKFKARYQENNIIDTNVQPVNEQTFADDNKNESVDSDGEDDVPVVEIKAKKVTKPVKKNNDVADVDEVVNVSDAKTRKKPLVKIEKIVATKPGVKKPKKE